jgi:exo-beta-1,3-glucanase (GH17 family)
MTILQLTALGRVLVVAILLAATGCGGGSSTSMSGSGSAPPPAPAPAFSSINLDYAPEGRCSDDNWSTTTPVACNPQLSFTTCTSGVLSSCEQNCQACYNADLQTISTLKVNTITIYQPNYYILTAAQNAGVKVVLGLYDDSVAGLAQPNSATNCTYGGQPFPYCGVNYATALFNGICGNVSPWPPANFCESSSNNPNPTYVAALNSTNAQFLQNGTVVGIQLGNEILGPQSAATISTAAQNLRTALNAAGFNSIKVIVSLIEGQAAMFCTNSAPPAGVDYIADHVYCSVGSSGGVASTPPVWPIGSNPAQTCWTQVMSVFATDQTSCGAANVFLGETGYNTGCPNVYAQQQVPNEQSFISQVVTSTCGNQVSGPLAPFLFEFGDVCPSGGCLAGCAGQPTEGNGYFGIYFTQNYLTKGPLESKFATVPTLTCP